MESIVNRFRRSSAVILALIVSGGCASSNGCSEMTWGSKERIRTMGGGDLTMRVAEMNLAENQLSHQSSQWRCAIDPPRGGLAHRARSAEYRCGAEGS